MHAGFILVAFLVLTGLYLLIRAFFSEPESSAKVSFFDKYEEKRKAQQPQPILSTLNLLGNFNLAILKVLPQIANYYRELLIKANSPLTPAGLLFLKEILLIVAFVACGPILQLPLKGLIIALTICFFAPDLLIKQNAAKRQFQILRTFPEIVDLLSLCLSAGLDFTSSLKWLTEGRFVFVNPLVDELRTIKDEIVLGKPKAQALKGLDKRLEIPEISSLVRTLLIAENMGVSVSDALDRFSVDARERRFHRGERQARIASIKILFPLIFLILPVVGIIIIGPIVLKFSQQGFSMGF